MRILLWYWGRRGGGAQFALALAEALARRPDVAFGLSLARGNALLPAFEALRQPLQVVSTYGGLAGAVAALARIPSLGWQLRQQARAMGAELVLSPMAHPFTPLIAPLLHRAGIPFVPVVHDALPHPGDIGRFAHGWRLQKELEAASAAVALSDGVAQAIALRRPDLPVLRLPLGAHAEVPPHRPRAPGTPFRFLFCGRIRPYKGLDRLRDAFRLLHTAHPGSQLLIAGEGDLEACAPGLAVLPGVTWRSGWLADAALGPLVADADALVLPYDEASQSGVAPLALAAGVPVIVTPVGGLPGQVRHDVDGLITRDLTPEALMQAMALLLEPATQARLAAGALASGAALRDWDAQAALLLRGLQGTAIGAAGDAAAAALSSPAPAAKNSAP